MNSINVNLPGRAYKIDIGFNIIDKCLPKAIANTGTDHVVVVTNTTLEKLYPDYIIKILKESSVRVSKCVIPDGEEYKNLESLS